MPRPTLSIRLSTHRDRGELARLAELDDSVPPSGRALIAERDGVAIAAVALTSGAVVADRSHDVGDAIPALRRRRYRLLRQGGHVARVSALVARHAGRNAAPAAAGAAA